MAIRLSTLGTFSSGIFDEGAAEIVAHDPASQRLFVVNSDAGQIDVLDIADPSAPALLFSFDAGDAVGGINSVAVSNGIVAAAVENVDEASPGSVFFFDIDGTVLNTVEVGVLPDMVTFTPDGATVLTANEGEPTDTVDPEGSVSIIDISNGVENATVRTADFTAFDGQEDALRADGVRIFPDTTVSQDVEPEYVAVSPDGATAWVTLQENNAVALVDIATAEISAIVPLGTKDHSVDGNGLDASDRDDAINIQTWPVVGMYMPDAIAAYQVGGETFYVTANEGDARDEDARVADLTLDPTAFPNAAELQQDEQLGRLEVSTIDGDTDGDGDFDMLFAYGSRSFTIWDSAGTVVFDSGDDLEQITADRFPDDFNSTNDENGSFDSRSDAKGPEPEGVVVGEVGDSFYAFVGLERIGGVAVYDVTNPAEATFVDYINNRDFAVEDAEAGVADGTIGDLGPEGLAFIAAEDSPTGVPLLAVGNEVSGTTTLYAVEEAPEADFTLQILHASDLEGGVEAIDNAPNFAAMVDFLEDQVDNSITLSSGDNVIPGPFFNAAGLIDGQVYNDFHNDLFGLPSDAIDEAYESLEGSAGRVDISIMNAIGFDAAALGNHEFDAGTNALAGFIEADLGDPGLADDEWIGAQFPYLAANLDTSADGNLDPIFTDEILPNTDFLTGPEQSVAGEDAPKIAPATIIDSGGEQIGVVGAVTPFLDTISSPGQTTVLEPGRGTSDMAALATILQPVIDDLIDQGIDKIIVTSHLQNIALEQELAGLLSGVDIIVAGGSETLLADDEDVARGLQPGDEAEGPYPILTENADAEPVVIVNTADEYSYVGRLVVDFDANGVIIPSSIDEDISGAFATTDEGVEALWGNLDDPFADGTKGAQVRSLTDAVSEVVEEQDGNIFGQTSVYLEGRRDIVRSEETNLGNITGDANLAAAQSVDETVAVSLKNGGGIRASIGSVGDNGELLPPEANPAAGKEQGEISQLDIDNTLRFNNGLSLVTVTPEQLVEIIEHGIERSWQHVGGIRFSYDPDNEVGSRVQTLATVDDNGEVVDVVVENGEIVGDPTRGIRVVTLDFLAEGGSGFPYPDFIAADPEFANVVELDGEDENGNGVLDEGEDTNLNGELDGPAITNAGAADFARPGSEQDAFAEYLVANFSDTPFDQADTPESGDTRAQNLNERQDTVLDGQGSGETFQLQILHASDLEGGVAAISNAPNFAALAEEFEAEIANTVILSAGDNYIPGPFFNAAGDRAAFRDSGVFNDTYNTLFDVDTFDSLREGNGRVDISIMNIIGFDASAIGNHEFDVGSDAFESIIEEDFRDPADPGGDRWVGAQFPYLSANLDFSNDGDLGNLFTDEILPNTAFATGPAQSDAGEASVPKIAPATIIEEGGERIGVIGATTPLLQSISSPTGTTLIGPTSNDMPALAAVLQPTIDAMTDDGIDKIILVSHLQQIALEEELATLLDGVDVIIAGGSDTLLANEGDVLRPGDVAEGAYPLLTTNGEGDPTAIVSTDGEYSYLGRLVVEFDENGVLIPDSIDDAVSGPIATTDEVVAAEIGDRDPFAAGTEAAEVQTLVDAVTDVVIASDGNIFGSTDVFIEGRREQVRTEETTLGNLTADANLALAQDVDDTVLVSLKNGGGIRAAIGQTDAEGTLLPPQANPDAGKEEGEISQLDIDNALRFNNGLTLITLSPDQLLAVLNHAVAATADGATPGQFGQVGGVSFSFDPDLPAGERVQSVALIDDNGDITETIAENGAVLDSAPEAIRVVTLDFLIGGGDAYPYPAFIEADPDFANVVDLADVVTEPGVATFADPGSEQDALAEYLAANFSDTPFSEAETDPSQDTRIQNLNEREDGIVPEEPAAGPDVLRYFNSENGAHFYTANPAEQDLVDANDAFAFEGIAFGNAAGEPGATAVTRFFNTDNGSHFYTISQEEIDMVQSTLPQYQLEGPAFEAFQAAPIANDLLTPVFRFFNTEARTHFYTVSEVERDLVDAIPAFEFEGIAFFA